MPRRESGNNTHVGRGGAANVFKPSAADLETAKKDGRGGAGNMGVSTKGLGNVTWRGDVISRLTF